MPLGQNENFILEIYVFNALKHQKTTFFLHENYQLILFLNP